MVRKALFLLLLATVLTGALRAEETVAADWTAPAWRSALVPGWGQAYNGDEAKAWWLGGSTWVLLGGVAVTYVEGEQALHDYEIGRAHV